MIPKRIISIWLNENPILPPLVKMCVQNQKRFCRDNNYEFVPITLNNCFKDSKYIKDCLSAGAGWSKISDYLRAHYLYTEGGIYLDTDVFIVPGKNFDALLENRMFAARENMGWVGTAVLGSEAGHPFIKSWMDMVEKDFRGDDEKYVEASVELISKGCYERNWNNNKKWDWDISGFEVYSHDYFYPYDHLTGTMNMTESTITIHFFMKSWTGKK